MDDAGGITILSLIESFCGRSLNIFTTMITLSDKTIGQYQLKKRLGTGSLGTVYCAQDMNLQREVAVKLIDPAYGDDPELRAQIMEAARLDSKLAHPAIVPFYNIVHTEEQFYLAMSYIAGMDLRSLLDRLRAQKKTLPLSEILFLMAQVADTLSYAHQEGIWHLNLHPGNILLRRANQPYWAGEPTVQLLLTDFRMTLLPPSGLQTAVFPPALFLPYISPEQCVGNGVNGRSDLYNLGCILYELISTQTPFQIHNVNDALNKHAIETPTPLSSLRNDIPPELEHLMQLLLAKKVSERVQSASQLADLLRYIAHEVLPPSSPDLFCLQTSFETMLQGEERVVSAEKTPIRPQRRTVPLMITPPSPQNGNGYPDTAVSAKPISPTDTQTVPQPGSILFAAMPTEISTATPQTETLFISRRGEATKEIQLDKPNILIGRSDKNDVVLEALDVSRQHLRLTQVADGWEVQDLDSQAGTFCNRRRLPSQQAIPWPVEETLIIGSYLLRWQKQALATAEQITQIPDENIPPEPKTELFQLPRGGSDGQSTHGQFSVALYPATVSLSAGEQTVVQVELFNQSLGADVYLLSLLGLPAGTAEFAQRSIPLNAGARTSLPITFVAPEEGSPQMRALQAGNFPFQLLVTSQTNQEETAVLNALLLVSPLEAFTLNIWPSQMSNPGNCRILIRNDGNFTTQYNLVAKDERGQLRFDGETAHITLAPGKAVTQKLRVGHNKRPFTGDAYAIPFTVEVRTRNGMVKTYQAAIRVTPQLPKWVVPVAQFALVLFLILLVVAIASTQIGGGIPRTPASNSSAPISTLDSDNDALTDEEEATFGTDPNNPDSDYDGLSDGDEMHNLNLNPLNSDTDEDGLPDGAEVNIYGTNPLQADTDGDGINDLDEVQQQSDPLTRP